MTGAERIAAERQRQVEAEGWTPEHDDDHGDHEMALAAICYAARAAHLRLPGAVWGQSPPPSIWPWARSWWKPSEDPVRNLEKAGALIAAEIDRRLRASAEAAS